MTATNRRPNRRPNRRHEAPRTLPGRRLALTLTGFGLALTTGVALLVVAMTLTSTPALPVGDGPNSVVVNVALATTFYEQINAVLAGGEPAALAALVADDYVEHALPSGEDGGRDRFLAELAGRRSAFPRLRLRVEQVDAVGQDRVLAVVAASGAEDGVTLGLSVTADLAEWRGLELVRLDDGRVVERWTSATEPPRLESIGEAPFDDVRGDWSPQLALDVQVARITIEPGAIYETPFVGDTRLIVMESGSVRTEPPALAGAPLNDHEAYGTGPALGSSFVVPSNDQARIHNDGAEAARLLDVEIRPSASAFPVTGRVARPAWAIPLDGTGVKVEPLMIALGLRIPAGQTLALGRLRLGPSTRLATVPVTAFVAAVEEGELQVEEAEGHLWVNEEATDPHWTSTASAHLAPGGGFLTVNGGQVEVRATGERGASAVLLVVSSPERTTLTPRPTSAPPTPQSRGEPPPPTPPPT